MQHISLQTFLDSGRLPTLRGPIAIIQAEDATELGSTIAHHLGLGFHTVLLLAPAAITLDTPLPDMVHRIDHDVFAEDALVKAVNRIAAATPSGVWLYYCYAAEYLFFPFCESRNITDLLAFHAEERRSAMLTYVVDLYAPDLSRDPSGLSREDACLDRTGYYALTRKDPDKAWQPKERQMDFYGGLRWRFEEHIPWTRRRIDRIALFRASPGLELRLDFTFSDEEMNTYACPWHNNLTAAVCSFRTARVLRSNPGSRSDIQTFFWHNSVRFEWNSQQLMDLGLMEPGQWF